MAVNGVQPRALQPLRTGGFRATATTLLNGGRALAAAAFYRLRRATPDKTKAEVLEEEAMLEKICRMIEPNVLKGADSLWCFCPVPGNCFPVMAGWPDWHSSQGRPRGTSPRGRGGVSVGIHADSQSL